MKPDSSKTIDVVATAVLSPERQKEFEPVWAEMARVHRALFTRVEVLPDKKTRSFVAAFSHDDNGARFAAEFTKTMQLAGMGAAEITKKSSSAKA